MTKIRHFDYIDANNNYPVVMHQYIYDLNYLIELLNLFLINNQNIEVVNYDFIYALITKCNNALNNNDLETLKSTNCYIINISLDLEKLILIPSPNASEPDKIYDLINEYYPYFKIDIMHIIHRNQDNLKDFILRYLYQINMTLSNIFKDNFSDNFFVLKIDTIDDRYITLSAYDSNSKKLKSINVDNTIPGIEELAKYYNLLIRIKDVPHNQIELYFLFAKIKEIHVALKIYEASISKEESCSKDSLSLYRYYTNNLFDVFNKSKEQ